MDFDANWFGLRDADRVSRRRRRTHVLKRAIPKAYLRIREVAGELFFREGIHAVGVDRIAAEAGVTKRTLYRHFETKEILIAAALRSTEIVRWPLAGKPADRVRRAFDAMIVYLERHELRGCPLNVAAAELPDPKHPGRVAIAERTSARRAWFVACARDAGATDPIRVGERLELLFDGALTTCPKRSDLAPARVARAAALDLMRSARAKPPFRVLRRLDAYPGASVGDRRPAQSHRPRRIHIIDHDAIFYGTPEDD